ncbi:MAG: hypothetical protein M3355_06010 [Actinomycetota bacterium]|nr:hypothetical protein [Actinomycetota bacterium]
MTSVSEDEFRVEVELDDDHEMTLSERLRSLDLDDEARERLGTRVIVTRDGSHLFLYANSKTSCDEAERVVRDLVSEDGLTAAVRSTRWHPIEEAWRDAGEPMPASSEAIRAEERARDERQETEDDGIPTPGFVLLRSYKPKFLRDLGL